MKYCKKCYSLVKDGDICSACGGECQLCTKDSSVAVAKVKGGIRSLVEPAFKEKGIPCEFFNPEKDIYTQLNAKVGAETEYNLLVPFEFYDEAFEVCVGLGVVNPDDKIEIDAELQSKLDGKTYDEKFTEATGTTPKVFKIIWIILFIVVACLLIFGVDIIANFVRELLGMPRMSNITNILL